MYEDELTTPDKFVVPCQHIQNSVGLIWVGLPTNELRITASRAFPLVGAFVLKLAHIQRSCSGNTTILLCHLHSMFVNVFNIKSVF